MARSLHIYGINYWPESTGIAPYTTAIARALDLRGWQVTVHAGVPHYPQWQVPDEYRRGFRHVERDSGVHLHRYRHYVPTSQSALRRATYEATFLLNGVRGFRRDRPDVILGVSPSLSGGVLAQLAARRHRVPFGLLVQDLMGNAADQSGVRGGGRVSRLIRGVEGRVARAADGVAIVAEGFRPSLHAMGVDPARVALLPNWSHVEPPDGDRAVIRRELGWDDATQVVLHAGNMGLKQGLEHVVAAARLAGQRGLPQRFVLMGNGSQRADLQRLALGLPNVQFLAPQSSERFMGVLAAADVLLVNERASVVDMSLPSKLTSYFMAGRPVVAATNPAGMTGQEVARSGAGLTVPAEDPALLLTTLEQLRVSPGLADQLGAAGPVYAAANLSAMAAYDRVETFLLNLLAGREARAPRPAVAPAVPSADTVGSTLPTEGRSRA